MKDFRFIQQVLQFNVLFESDVYSSMIDDTGLSIGFMNTSELEEAAQAGYKASVVPNFRSMLNVLTRCWSKQRTMEARF